MDDQYNFYNLNQENSGQTETPGQTENSERMENPAQTENSGRMENPGRTENSDQGSSDHSAYNGAYSRERFEYYGQEDPNSIFYEKQRTPHRKKREKKKIKFPKWVQAACLGLVLGVAACAAFQTGNLIANRLIGNSGVRETARNQSAAVSNAQLTRTSSTVMSDVSEIVKNAMPSVVSITNLSVQEVQGFFGGGIQREIESCGSGIIVGQNEKELLIVTNNHVVEGSKTLTVTFIDEESVEANIKGTDATRDLAVVAVPVDSVKDSTKDQISVANLGNSDELQVGEPAIAIGNALGYGQSVTTGIISATHRDLEGFDSELIQTDAAINPGNSGGALLNANGDVIGINTVKVNADAVEGMGYAIPITDASEVITTLMNRETRTKVAEDERGYIGIRGVDVTEDSAALYQMPTGVYISEIIEGGAAEKAGLSRGSIITGLEGLSIDGMESLQGQLEYYRAGETIELTVQIPGNDGNYQEKEVSVTLQEGD